MISEKREKQILMISFVSGLLFAIAELIFALFSHSQSSLTDAVYDASELVFITMMMFLTPLFYKPVSEKHPYGFFQIETIFIIVKNVMLLSVTGSVLLSVVETALSGGNMVNGWYVSIFQFCLGIASVVIYWIMKKMNRNMSSPMIEGELLGWKLDIGYSMGMSLAFLLSLTFKNTSLECLTPYFDAIMAIVVMVFMMPECIRMLVTTVRELFLFSPEEDVVQQIKEMATSIVSEYGFTAVFYDITRTGRHLWVGVYYEIKGDYVCIGDLKAATQELSLAIQKEFGESTCELILA